jgi:hypothetical protein
MDRLLYVLHSHRGSRHAAAIKIRPLVHKPVEDPVSTDGETWNQSQLSLELLPICIIINLLK